MTTTNEPTKIEGAFTEVSMELRELTTLLIKHYKYKEGLYDLIVQLRIGTGAVGAAEKLLPGAAVGVAEVGLRRVEKAGPNTLDASEVNRPASSRKSGSPPDRP